MNTQEIAQHLLNRRNAMNPVIYPGEMVADLGSDAMQEALQKRWLVPNHESGLLQVSVEGGKIDEMRIEAAKCPAVDPEKPAADQRHGYAFEHAMRRGYGTPLQELLSPGTGHQNDNGLTGPGAPVPPTPLTPTSPTTPPKTSVGPDGKPIGAATMKDGKLQIDLDKNNPASAGLARQLAVRT